MTGPYQPVIIRTLLEEKGKASLEKIAQVLAALDRESIQYYQDKLRIYPRQVLHKHGIAELERSTYRLNPELIPETKAEQSALKEICDRKIAEYYTRGDDDPESKGWGLIRVKLINEHPYCAYCGARPGPDSHVELDIDHIEPRSKGGTDELDNLQVLCHRCNRAKGNHMLKTPSSRVLREKTLAYTPVCAFCMLPKERILYKDEYVMVIADNYPVTKGHRLIIPTRHFPDATSLNPTEVAHMFAAFKKVTEDLRKEDKSITGFNMGFNMGQSAGQTIFHVHMHVIPRRAGDVEEPRGGIRGVIPAKQKY